MDVLFYSKPREVSKTPRDGWPSDVEAYSPKENVL